MIKTFRGLMVDGGQDTIVLHTNDGSIGYRIVKLQVMPKLPGTVSAEHVVQVFKISQVSVPTTNPEIDFSDNTLLAAAVVGNSTNMTQHSPIDAVIFDNEIFNQDIFVTHTEANAGEECNYYIELEQVKLDLDENTVATLKNIKNEATTIL